MFTKIGFEITSIPLMCLLPLLLFRSTYTVSCDETSYMLDSFGFESGGGFQVSVNGLSDRFALLLATDDECTNIPDTYMFDVCTASRHIADINVSFGREVTEPEWSGTIGTKGVYYLVIVLCGTCSEYEVNVLFANPNSFLDYRIAFLPVFYFAYSWVWMIITCIWIANGLMYLRIRIDVHSMCGLAALVKTLDLFVCGVYWERERNGISNSSLVYYMTYATEIPVWILLLSITSLMSSGWGTYLEDMQTRYKLKVVAASVCIIASVLVLLDLLWAGDHGLLLIPVSVCLSLPYLRLWCDGIGTVSAITVTEAPVGEKVEMVKRMLRYMVKVVYFAMISSVITMFLENDELVYVLRQVLDEVCVGLVMMIFMIVFLMRERYLPGDNEGELDDMERTPVRLRKIDDPEGISLVLLDGEREMMTSAS